MRSVILIFAALVACGDSSPPADAAIEPMRVVQTATFGPATGTTFSFELPDVTTGWFVTALTSTGGFGKVNVGVDRYWPMTLQPCGNTSLMAFAHAPADGNIEVTLFEEGTATLFVMEVSEYSMPPMRFVGPHQDSREIAAEAGQLVVSLATSCDTVGGITSSSPFIALDERMGTALAYYVPSEAGTFEPPWSSQTVDREYVVLGRR